MNASETIRRIKPWILPLAMVIGMLLHEQIGAVEFLSPYLIFLMLLITYCKVSLRHFRIDKSMWLILLIQMAGAAGVYLALRPINETVAQSTFICIFCPTATAAPVITGMLGGRIERVATYSLICNLFVAVSAPALLAWIGSGDAVGSFSSSVTAIGLKVIPMILGPLIVASALKATMPRVREAIASHQGLSFYIWAFSLIIVVGNSVSFIMKEPPSCIPIICLIAALSLVACLGQFYIGNRIGRRYGDAIAGAQSFGQKNTVLAIWLALAFLNPLASVGPASYIVWHNSVNSWQIYRNTRKKATPDR